MDIVHARILQASPQPINDPVVVNVQRRQLLVVIELRRKPAARTPPAQNSQQGAVSGHVVLETFGWKATTPCASPPGRLTQDYSMFFFFSESFLRFTRRAFPMFDDVVKFIIIRVNAIDSSHSVCSVQLGLYCIPWPVLLLVGNV